MLSINQRRDEYMAKRKDEELLAEPAEESVTEVPFQDGPADLELPVDALPMNYEAAWAALKDFAIRHHETRKCTGKTFGQMIEEFVEKIETGSPV